MKQALYFLSILILLFSCSPIGSSIGYDSNQAKVISNIERLELHQLNDLYYLKIRYNKQNATTGVIATHEIVAIRNIDELKKIVDKGIEEDKKQTLSLPLHKIHENTDYKNLLIDFNGKEKLRLCIENDDNTVLICSFYVTFEKISQLLDI